MSEGPLPDKIQKLLAGLPPAARQALERAVEKARQNGLPDPLFDLLGQQFSQAVPAKKPERPLDPSRLFMKPLENFLVDAHPPQKIPGRIWRGSLQGLWGWIESHVAGEEISECRKALQDNLGASEEQSEVALTSIEKKLRSQILPKLQNELERVNQTPDIRRRFSYQIGGESQLQELEDIVVLLKHCDIVQSLEKILPATLSLNSNANIALIVKIFTKLASIDAQLPYYAGILLYKRIEQSAQLPLWAAACVRSDDLKQIATSPFAILIEIALSDAALMAEQCITELTKPSENNQAIVFARNYAMICRNLRAAVDFETQASDWLRRLSEIRMRISSLLGEELGQMFQLLRRNVRPLRAFGSQNPIPPDAFDLDRLCFLIALLNTVRSYVQEFVLNELVNRIHNECENYLQIAFDSLQEELRTQFSNNRRITQAYTQAAVRVSEVWYGEKNAAVLQRSFEAATVVAGQKAADAANG